MEQLDSRQLIDEWQKLMTQETPLTITESKHVLAIRLLMKELKENCDEEPENGITLVAKDDFVEYVRDYAEDCGYNDMQRQTSYGTTLVKPIVEEWPFKHIDWNAAAEELAQNFYEVEFEGETYLAR